VCLNSVLVTVQERRAPDFVPRKLHRQKVTVRQCCVLVVELFDKFLIGVTQLGLFRFEQSDFGQADHAAGQVGGLVAARFSQAGSVEQH